MTASYAQMTNPTTAKSAAAFGCASASLLLTMTSSLVLGVFVIGLVISIVIILALTRLSPHPERV